MSQILPMLAQGFYSEPLQFDRLPSGLEAYYQSHWQHITGKGLSSVELGVLHCLACYSPTASGFPSPLLAESPAKKGRNLSRSVKQSYARRAYRQND